MSKFTRSTIIFICVIGLLSAFPITLTSFAYGIGDVTYFVLLLYPSFLTATILVIAKVRLGYILTLIVAMLYAFLLMQDVGYFFVFEPHNVVLLPILLLPFLSFLLLIPLTVHYLFQIKWIRLSAIIVATGILIFAIAERYDKNYERTVFISADISPTGLINLTCSPGFGDSRIFHITSHSKELEQLIKKYGEYHQGDYLLLNTPSITNFRFSIINSFTIEKIGPKTLSHPITWMTKELHGDIDFLKP